MAGAVHCEEFGIADSRGLAVDYSVRIGASSRPDTGYASPDVRRKGVAAVGFFGAVGNTPVRT